MKWEVFDWGRKKNQLAEKDRTIEQAKNGLREAESLVLIEVGDKFRKLQQTRQALVVAQLRQETARENMRVSVNKYKLAGGAAFGRVANAGHAGRCGLSISTGVAGFLDGQG